MSGGHAEVVEFLQAIAPKEETPVRVQMGVVTAIAGNTVSLKIANGATEVSGIRFLASYVPVVTDVVIILANGPDKIVLGDLA